MEPASVRGAVTTGSPEKVKAIAPATAPPGDPGITDDPAPPKDALPSAAPEPPAQAVLHPPARAVPRRRGVRAGLLSLAAAAALAATLLFTGFGASRGPAGGPATLEDLAARTGCARPSLQVDAAELRQGMCATPQGRYSITTFATDQGRDQWLADAVDYGGAYLVGTRWILVGNTQQMLEHFRAQLGGTIRLGGHQGPGGDPAMSGHAG
ncbi:hypothetical protein BJ992_002621 [Sphaerisporangium rubeum]|uniref:Uncharacterized protein n=1 Tax=Sphaerisporangium rubeum TaxID=321317 RepID=A0A7X0IDD1_9ACTN|nr:hypothetical protein [Sphaerisporangium rubeum]